MTALPTRAALAAALRPLPATAGIAADDLEKLADKGLAHAHWRIARRGLLLRVPRAGDAAAVARQEAAFTRAAPSGHVPRLHARLPATADLPGGALVVEEIDGMPPRLPGDLGAIAAALAAIHGLPLPAIPDPLPAPADPLAELLATVERNLGRARLDPASAAVVAAERDWARGFLRTGRNRLPAAPRALTLADTHPGNFLIRRDGRAVFLDLEKAGYGHPAVDLAHATLAVSVAWDADCAAPLSSDDLAAFHAAYFSAGGDQALGPWLIPCRRLVWLRTTAFYARAAAEPDLLAGLAPAIRAHVEAIIAAHLQPRAMIQAVAEWRVICS